MSNDLTMKAKCWDVCVFVCVSFAKHIQICTVCQIQNLAGIFVIVCRNFFKMVEYVALGHVEF